MSNEIATKPQRNSNNLAYYFDSQTDDMNNNKNQYVLSHGCDKLKLISRPRGGCITLLTTSNGSTKCKEFSIFKNARHMAEWLIHDGWKLAGNGELKP